MLYKVVQDSPGVGGDHIDQLEEEILLALEIEVNRAHGHFSRLGDILNLGVGIAVFTEEALGRFEDNPGAQLSFPLPSLAGA